MLEPGDRVGDREWLKGRGKATTKQMAGQVSGPDTACRVANGLAKESEEGMKKKKVLGLWV